MNTLHTFFSWTLGTSLRASLLAIVVLGLQATLRGRLSARSRYLLWLPVVFVLVMPVLPESRWSAEQLLMREVETVSAAPAEPSVTIESTPAVTMNLPLAKETPSSASSTPIDWQQVTVVVWLLGVLGFLVGGLGSYALIMRRIRRQAVSAGDSLTAQVQSISAAIRLRRAPLVRLSPRVGSPAVAGLWRPVLLLPADFETTFSSSEAKLVLKHELMHLKRFDLPVNALLCVLQALHWFNPLLWFAAARARQDRESACDAQVLASDEGDCRSDYGHALLKVQTAYCPRGFSLGFVGIFASRAAVRERIEAIASYRRVHPLMSWLVTLMIGALGLVGATRAQSEAKQPSDKTMAAMKERFDAYKALLADVQKLQKEAQDPAFSAEVRAKAAETFTSKLKEARDLEKEINQQQRQRADELKKEQAEATSSKPAASVNGTVITVSEVADAVAAQQQTIRYQHRDNPKTAEEALAKVRTTALDSLIDRELIMAEFKKMGGTIKAEFIDADIEKIIQEQFKGDREKFIAELAKSGTSMKKFRELREKMMIVQVMRSRQTGKPALPTHPEIEAYIASHSEAWHQNDKVILSTITIPQFAPDSKASAEPRKQLANELRVQLVAGEDFATLARKHSQDSHAPQGGEWPEMEIKALAPALRKAALTTKTGEVSPVIEDKAAFIILKVNQRHAGDASPSKETQRTEAVKRLQAEQGKAKVEAWLAGLRQKATIKTF